MKKKTKPPPSADSLAARQVFNSCYKNRGIVERELDTSKFEKTNDPKDLSLAVVFGHNETLKARNISMSRRFLLIGTVLGPVIVQDVRLAGEQSTYRLSIRKASLRRLRPKSKPWRRPKQHD